MSNTIVAQSAPKIHHEQPNMLTWALRYADLGYHVMPCHEPLFDDPRGYVCTCEPWRHTDACKAKRPDLYLEPHQHCANPGKHPRGLEHGLKEASNDPAVIRRWWGKFPNANIAHVPGRAGLVMLDGDTYKAEYAGDEMELTAEEQHTLRVRSGKGGTHLYYRKHAGATYTNAKGTLPAGIDVRGDNGYALLPPSINSGGRYSWDDGHNPRDLEPQLLPLRIHDILAAASARTARTSASFSTPLRWDGTPSTPAPDLAKWKLSIKVRQMIAHPAAKGQRSEADAKVVQSLVYAGAADDDILAVFEHNPCGTAGKFAEGGRRYLERTISAARAYAEEHPRPAPVGDTIAKVRAWLQSIDLAEHVPTDKQCSTGYRTRERDLAVADAILEAFEDYDSLDGPLGLRQLRKMTNLGSLNTVARALDSLTPWFIRPVISSDDGADAAHRYVLACCEGESCCVNETPPLAADVVGVSFTQQIYSEYRAHDAFNATTRPIAPEDAGAYSTKYTLTSIYRRRLRAVLPAAGRTALVLVDALVKAGGYMPYAALVGLGGRKKHTISRAFSRLEELDFVTIDANRGVDLREDWREWLDKVAGLMPTHGNGKRRIVRDALATLEACATRESEAQEAGTEAPGWIEQRKRRAERELARLAPTFWRLQKQQIGAVPMGHVHTGPNGLLLEEQLPELREMAYRYGVAA